MTVEGEVALNPGDTVVVTGVKQETADPYKYRVKSKLLNKDIYIGADSLEAMPAPPGEPHEKMIISAFLFFIAAAIISFVVLLILHHVGWGIFSAFICFVIVGVIYKVVVGEDGPVKTEVPHCPSCGSTDIQRFSRSWKVTKVATVGVFGLGNVHKIFHCENCGYKW